MKKTILALLLVSPLALSLSGCVLKINDDGGDHGFVTDSEDRAYNNRNYIAKIVLGTNIAAIQERLGVADFSAAYSQNEKTVKVLYYRTQRKHKDGLTTKDECTYLQFSNGELIATGHGDEFKK
jgi:hypothetical protein